MRTGKLIKEGVFSKTNGLELSGSGFIVAILLVVEQLNTNKPNSSQSDFIIL